jgi:hypothetical protein
MKTITITWKAFGNPTSATIEWDYPDTGLHSITVCEQVYEATNLYRGALWDALEPHLPENRTHTALSVGDEVEIVGFLTHRCEPAGWSIVEKESA